MPTSEIIDSQFLLTVEAVSPTKDEFGRNLLVKDGLVGDKLHIPEEHCVGKDTQEDNEKRDTPEKIGKNR